jgi:CRISPR-associated protein Csm1
MKTKIAFAGFLHDIGKFAQRADVPLTKNRSLYNYTHAAYTAEILEKYINIFGLTYEEIDYSAMHHNLNKNMDDEYWIIASADRVASGFERETFDEYNKKSEFEEFKKQHLLSIFNENKTFKLAELSPQNIFSSKEGDYKTLWNNFIKDLEKISLNEKNSENTIDYLYKKYTTFIPSSTSFKLKDYNPVKANIPLYDHSKTTAIFASVIEKLVENNRKSVINYYKYKKLEDFEKNEFLIVFGDFFGIQNFIFDKLKSKYASKILRAKSAYIEILTTIIAKYICKETQISEFSIISKGAGKFEILLPNLDEVKNSLKKIKNELNEFCINEFFGETGIGIGFVECGIKDFIEKNGYKKLRDKIDSKLEEIKLNKFDLSKIECKLPYEKITNQTLCPYCEKRKIKNSDEKICNFCEKFVQIGQKLASNKFISIGDKGIKIFKDFCISFDNNPTKLNGDIFDITNDDEFRGYAKWEISSYVPTIKSESNEIETLTFEEIAKLSVIEGIKDNKRENGVEALGVLKADVDFMGKFILGESGINITASFAKFNFFSRLMNYFFSVYVPFVIRKKYNYIYTIFSGGDDLYIIGPWDMVIDFTRKIREEFIRFCENKMKLSAGYVMVKSNKPIDFVSRVVEEAENTAKNYKESQAFEEKEKNAIAIFEEVLSFDEFNDEDELLFIKDELEEFNETYPLSTAFLYRLIDFCEHSKKIKNEKINFEDLMWISRFNYIFKRNIEEKVDFKISEFKKTIFNAIKNKPISTKIALFEFIYKRRKNEN